MSKETNSLYIEKEIWKRIDEQAKLMRRNRSEFVELTFAEMFGMTEFIPAPMLPVPKVKDK